MKTNVFWPIMEYQITFDVSSLIFLCEIVLANLRERQKAVNSYPPSIHLTSEQTPQLATGTHHPSLLLKPDLSWKDSCTGQRAKALSKMYYHKKKKGNSVASVFQLTAFLNMSSPRLQFHIFTSNIIRNLLIHFWFLSKMLSLYILGKIISNFCFKSFLR